VTLERVSFQGNKGTGVFSADVIAQGEGSVQIKNCSFNSKDIAYDISGQTGRVFSDVKAGQVRTYGGPNKQLAVQPLPDAPKDAGFLAADDAELLAIKAVRLPGMTEPSSRSASAIPHTGRFYRVTGL
jgi:hypothetical protein